MRLTLYMKCITWHKWARNQENVIFSRRVIDNVGLGKWRVANHKEIRGCWHHIFLKTNNKTTKRSKESENVLKLSEYNHQKAKILKHWRQKTFSIYQLYWRWSLGFTFLDETNNLFFLIKIINKMFLTNGSTHSLH